MRSGNVRLVYFACILLTACGTQPLKPSDKHLQREQGGETNQAANIPQPVKRAIPLPPPAATPKPETYSVVVTNVPVQEILFALARDAKINLDVHAGIQGAVTLNAIDQTLPQILSRIARQVDMRYELDNGTLSVMPDSPYLKQYRIDYVNMSRDSDGSISNSTQVGAGVAGGGGAPTGGTGGNSSLLSIKNISKNHFWETLIQNIKDILHETDKILPSGSSETVVQQISAASSTGTGVQPTAGKKSAPKGGIENSPNPVSVQEGGTTVTRTSTFREAATVIANQETGIITIRATGKQHEKIQEFIDKVMSSARRQVLIEVTVAEVTLNNNYQQGIDWARLRLGAKGFQLTQAATQAAAGGLLATQTGSMFILNYANPTSNMGNLNANISLLESFGTVKVLSSPKLSVMNNQTAILRVVDNRVYFKIDATVTPGGALGASPIATYTTTPNTVPIGFTMSVTPQISDNDSVQIDLRPSVTRLLRYIPDPNPSLANPCGIGVNNCSIPPVVSSIPEVQMREMESILKIENNQIAVLGGLMEDRIDNFTDEVPGLSKIPLAGGLFKNRNDKTTKTELVIFLRPAVIKDASMNGDFSAFRSNLPDQNFFKESASSSKP